MSKYKLMEHKEKPEIKFWARKVRIKESTGYASNFPVSKSVFEVKYPRKMYADARAVPGPELCVWSGYLQAAAVRELYCEAKEEPPESLPPMTDKEIDRHYTYISAEPGEYRRIWRDGRVWKTVHKDLLRNENYRGDAVYNALTGERITADNDQSNSCMEV